MVIIFPDNQKLSQYKNKHLARFLQHLDSRQSKPKKPFKMTLTEISNLTVTDKENQGQSRAKKDVKKSVEQEEPLLKENPQRYIN